MQFLLSGWQAMKHVPHTQFIYCLATRTLPLFHICVWGRKNPNNTLLFVWQVAGIFFNLSKQPHKMLFRFFMQQVSAMFLPPNSLEKPSRAPEFAQCFVRMHYLNTRALHPRASRRRRAPGGSGGTGRGQAARGRGRARTPCTLR